MQFQRTRVVHYPSGFDVLPRTAIRLWPWRYADRAAGRAPNVKLLRDLRDFFATVSRSREARARADCPTRPLAAAPLGVPPQPAQFRPASSPGYAPARTCLVAATRLVSDAETSSGLRVFRPQSGLTHSRSAGTAFSAARSDVAISSVLGTRGEWMS